MKTLLAVLLALPLLLLPTSAAGGSTTGVRDAANMFSTDAITQAHATLEKVRQAHGWEIIFETVDQLGDKSVDQLAVDKARSQQVRGVFVLLAKKEHRISIQVNAAAEVFDAGVRETLKQKVTTQFKENQFDQGLLDAVDYLAAVAAERTPGKRAVAAQAPTNSAAPTESDGPADRSSLIMTALVIAAVVAGVLLLFRLISGAGQHGRGTGGGFFSSMFGALGGVLVGSWLYNSFFGGSAHADDHSGSPTDPASPEPYNDHYESTSGGWGGDDGGGFDGGDFGGGDGGGGDW